MREREWRSTNLYKLNYDDVSMVVVPNNGEYFERLCEDAAGLSIPRSIPIVAWEDLVEH